MERRNLFEERDVPCIRNCDFGVEMREGKAFFKKPICPYCRLYAKRENNKC